MYWNGKKKNSSDTHFNDCFERMKSIGGPGRRIGRLVMNKMKEFKDFWMMHQPVRPVEIGVVNNKHQRERSIKIKPSMFFDLCVKCSVWLDSGVLDKK